MSATQAKPRRYYRKRQAYDRCPWGDTKTWELIKEELLPAPIAHLGPKLPIFDADAWDSALDALIAKAGAELAPDIAAEARRARAKRRELKPAPAPEAA